MERKGHGHGTSIVRSWPEVKMHLKGELTIGRQLIVDHSKGEECKRFINFHKVEAFEVLKCRNL
jgi:hypothetical protein